MKAHPIAGDSLLAAMVAVFDLLLLIPRYALAEEAPPAPRWFVAVPVIVAMVLPLVIRRRHPVWSAYLILLIGTPHSLLQLGVGSMIAALIALYTLVSYVGRRTALLYLAIHFVVAGIQLPLQYESSDEWVPGAIVMLSMLGASWALGEFVGARRAYQAEVEQRLALLETERDHQAQIAVAEERARIARELHDVVAHAVSVIVVHADGARYAVRTQPELAARAIETISSTGREALTELRRLLGVLRSDDGTGDEQRSPQPSAGSLAELAERVRSAGLPVRLEVTGDLEDLPTGVGLGIYRITQEALTNSLKHAGSGATASVRVERFADRVELSVRDNGRQHAPTLADVSRINGVSGGNGLIGMRERAHVYGGTLEVGPHPNGGWRVHATLPLGEAANPKESH